MFVSTVRKKKKKKIELKNNTVFFLCANLDLSSVSRVTPPAVQFALDCSPRCDCEPDTFGKILKIRWFSTDLTYSKDFL